MEQAWQIRAATIEDSDGLKACMASAYTEYRGRMGGVRLPPMDADYRSEIQNYSTWVVESRGEILGGLILSFDNDRATLANIAVDPRCRGRGIGGALMKLAESTARDRGFSELHLATHVLLHENISLYRHLGWEESGRVETRVFMKKEI